MVSEPPNLTLDTSCIVPLLHLPDDFSDRSEIYALEKIQKAHTENRLAIWVSKKSVNESLMNLQNPNSGQIRYAKWLDTLRLLDDYNKTASVLVLDISRLDYDAVLVSDEQADAFMKIEQVIKGNKSKLDIGDVYDITILYEHYLQGNELFITLDAKIFRKTVMRKLDEKFGIRVVTPLTAVSILESEYKIHFN